MALLLPLARLAAADEWRVLPESSIQLVQFDVGNLEDPSWFDNLSVFVGLEGSKQPQDVGINANFGGRAAFNLAMPVWDDAGLGVQLGTALVGTDNAVQVLEAIDGTGSRFQSFTTLGVFQQSPAGWEWALAWDFLYESYYDDFALNQLRGRVGLDVSQRDQIGVWGTWSPDETNANVGGVPVRLSPINQVNMFWKHDWQTGVETEGWIGVAEGHGKVVHVFPGDSGLGAVPMFGAALQIPLNQRLAIYGQGNFILPSDSGTVDAYLGIVYHFDDARVTRRKQYSPPLDVAGSTSFSVDLRR
ncbi:MAG: DUF6666 family protein [Planctomycetaceae bacterium]